MPSIARAAGVGQGTIYRHFPSREALLLEVYQEDFDALVAAAPALLAGHRPDVALRRWLDELAVLWQLDTRTDPRIPHLLDLVLDAARAPHDGSRVRR
jgi:AcrR family transcriptional regulator